MKKKNYFINLLYCILFLQNYYYFNNVNEINYLFGKEYYKMFKKEKILFLVLFTSNVYGTKLYWTIVYSKTDYVKSILIKGFSVILCDTDLNFLKDPRNYIMKYNTDLVTSCDHRCPNMNSGF